MLELVDINFQCSAIYLWTCSKEYLNVAKFIIPVLLLIKR